MRDKMAEVQEAWNRVYSVSFPLVELAELVELVSLVKLVGFVGFVGFIH